MLKDIVDYVVKSLVEDTGSVVINVVQQGGKDLYEIQVGTQDIGKVIGKDGQTIRALRMLLTALAPQGQEIEVTITK